MVANATEAQARQPHVPLPQLHHPSIRWPSQVSQPRNHTAPRPDPTFVPRAPRPTPSNSESLQTRLQTQQAHKQPASSSPTTRRTTSSTQRPSPQCPVRIYFCFSNDNARAQLRSILLAAIAKWHNVLGPLRGLDFALAPADAATGTPAEMCRDAAGRWLRGRHPDTVEVKVGHFTATRTLGWAPGREPGRMTVTFDLTNYRNMNAGELNSYWNALMAYELGHVMGLDHEHQRFDAPQHITLIHENLLGIDRLDARIARWNTEQPRAQKVTREMFLSNARWAFRFNRYLGPEDRQCWEGMLPWGEFVKTEAVMVEDGWIADYMILNVVNEADHDVMVDKRLHGPFDWESIMLYHSWVCTTGDNSYQGATMRKKSDGSTWGTDYIVNNMISRGDVNAVKHSYPDVA